MAFSIEERLTVFCSLAMDGVGLIATRIMIGMPLDKPPKMPPAFSVEVRLCRSSTGKHRYSLNPSTQPALNPAPNSTPFTAGTANSALAKSASKRIKQWLADSHRHVKRYAFDYSAEAVAFFSRVQLWLPPFSQRKLNLGIVLRLHSGFCGFLQR